MSFAWPWMLLGLAAIPLLVTAFRRLQRRRDARRAELARLGLAAPSAQRRRRNPVPVLLLTAVTLLLVSLARPEATVAEPRREGTVILAFDVSNSMAAKDLAPSRMEAAKAAARDFVRQQPPSIRVGVVAFGESGLVTAQPTNVQGDVLAAIDRLTPQGGTSVGRGLQTSLSAIAGKPVQLDEGGETGEGEDRRDLGYFGSSVVVLLSDGENTAEPDPMALAELASAAGVRVYPIGIGSPQGTVLEIDGFQVATALDEQLLRDIANRTDGEYFAAADEQSLAKVYDSIDLEWTTQPRRMEVTALVAALAALLLLLGTGLSFLRHGRVV